jgi:hypothetical protein
VTGISGDTTPPAHCSWNFFLTPNGKYPAAVKVITPEPLALAPLMAVAGVYRAKEPE